MAASSYASALGRLKPEFTSFLTAETFAQLAAAKDPGEVAKILEGTAYGPDVQAARAAYQGVALVEIATNRLFVRRNRHAYEATPFAGRGVVAAYLARWDLQNITLILAAKAQGRPVTETDEHLVSSREIPAGLYAGVLTLDDFRSLLAQPSIEAIATGLVKYGYGATILPLVEQFQRTHNIFPVVHALDREYYRRVIEAAKYFQGDEWVVRQFLASEIDLRNALLLLKGKAADLPMEEVSARWLDGGTILAAQVPDLYGTRNVPELADRLAPRFPSIGQGTEEYNRTQSLARFETVLERDRAVGELKRMRTYPLSLSVIFAYLLLAEIEREDIRRIAFGKLYGMGAEKLEPLLVMPHA
ncbi:MAG TPA: V-type ATPase subunit [Thermoplasmata archaeon]|nr:V-type ATPase subunit [Thermoplasmata archaeon]